ncbi:MAG: hypothetical protein JWO36_6708, partial [Myxococcales bacterium]|nr:hypothetical protein [Myxococcales bacterium]
MPSSRLFIAPLLMLAACGSDATNTSGIPDQCNPLGGEGCLLPWPSMAYAIADTSSATGFRLALPIEAMPANIDNVAVDPKLLNRWDGFSPTGPILVAFPTGISGTNLPSWKDPDKSLAADAPIILVDMATGERAPYFAEIDQNIADVTKRDLIIRPLARLHAKSRYAVGIRKTVKAADGSDLPSPAAFVAMRDGGDFSHPRFAALKARSSDVFTALAAAGVAKADLALAWDYVTASDEFLQSDLLAMRSDALPAIGTNGANVTFTTMQQPPAASVYKQFTGTFKSPDFLTNGEADDSIMRRDAAGRPQMMGMRDAQFAAIIPDCVRTMPLPRPVIIFGHGLFGSAKDYLNDSFVQSIAADKCLIIIAGDFIGLTSRQIALAPLAVNDMNKGTEITEKLAQSIIDFIALENAAHGPMAASPEFQFNGMSVIDKTKIYYVGGSLGGIMGNTFMAYDPNITRGVLAVPGGAWSMLFERSNAWHLLQGSAMGSYADPESYQLIIAILGMGMEPYDPITTAAHVLRDPLPGSPAKTILMWYTVGDCLVSNITTELVARTMGIDFLAPAAKTAWGLTPKPGPLVSGINVYDAHPTPLPPDTNIPPAVDNGTHSGINRKPSALRQINEVLLGNQSVVQTCR